MVGGMCKVTGDAAHTLVTATRRGPGHQHGGAIAGASRGGRGELKRAFRLLFRSTVSMSERLAAIGRVPPSPEWTTCLARAESERGFAGENGGIVAGAGRLPVALRAAAHGGLGLPSCRGRRAVGAGRRGGLVRRNPLGQYGALAALTAGACGRTSGQVEKPPCQRRFDEAAQRVRRVVAGRPRRHRSLVQDMTGGARRWPSAELRETTAAGPGRWPELTERSGPGRRLEIAFAAADRADAADRGGKEGVVILRPEGN